MEMTDYTYASQRFLNLKKGDKIKVKGVLGTCICESDAFWNCDGDETDWEVLTNKGFISIQNYIKYL